MPAFIDLAGQHCGKWKVLRLASDPRPGSYWVCVCDPEKGGCGREKVVVGQSLREGRSSACRSCGSTGHQPRLGHTTSPSHRAAISAALAGRPRAKVPLTCRQPECGRTFDGTPSQRYCGVPCRDKAKRGRQPTVDQQGRLDLARRLRAERKTLAEIGVALGVTKQRVQQMLAESE